MKSDIRELFSYQLALLTRANDRDAQSQLMADCGLTLGEWRTLAVIHALSPCTSRALATEGFLDYGQVSRTVKLLSDRGLISTRPSEEDRRAIHLTLTPEGEALHEAVFCRVVEANDRTLSVLSDVERRQLMGLMRRLFESLQ